MQHRVRIGDRPYWFTTHCLDGEWYAVGKFESETITVAAGSEADAIELWRQAAQLPEESQEHGAS